MLKQFFYFLAVFFIIQGCAVQTYYVTKRGTVSIGMHKSEVVAILGNPYDRGFLEDEDKSGRYELWYYHKKGLTLGHAVEIAFNKIGYVVYIETLYK